MQKEPPAKLLGKIFCFSFLIYAILFYAVIWHFDIINKIVDVSMLSNFMPKSFIVKLAENEPYEKGILLGFIIFISIILSSILTCFITIRGLIFYKGDIFVKPLLNNLERAHIKNCKRKKPYNEDGFFYKFFIQPDTVSPFILKQNTERPLSRFLFSVLTVFLCWASVWGLSNGFFDKGGFETKFKQFIICIFFPAFFSGTIVTLIISFYRSFNNDQK